MVRSPVFWHVCTTALVVAAAVMWFLGVTGWGVFAAVLVMAAASTATTAIDDRRRRDASR